MKITLFKQIFILFSIFLIIGCSKSQTKIKYLALGDSYTIGESVKENERWPNQLVSRLEKKFNYSVKLQIVAKTGYTTGELLEKINKTNINSRSILFIYVFFK